MGQTDINQHGNFSTAKGKFLLFVKLFVSAAILYFMINFIEFSKIREAIKDANIMFVVFAVLLLPLNLFFQFKKWEFVCNSMLNNQDKKQIWASLFYGISGGLITPLQAGEYITRAVPLQNVSFVKTAVATAVDKFFPLLIVSFAGSILALPFLHYYFGISETVAVIGLIAVFLFFILLFIVVFKYNRWGNVLLQKLGKIKLFKTAADELKEIGKLNKRFSIKMIWLSVLLILTYSLQFTLIISAFTHHFNFLDYLWFVIIVLFAKTILPPVTFGEIGIREAVSVYFGSFFCISQAAAFNAALVLFMINLIIPAVFGFTLFTVKGK